MKWKRPTKNKPQTTWRDEIMDDGLRKERLKGMNKEIKNGWQLRERSTRGAYRQLKFTVIRTRGKDQWKYYC